MDCGVVEGRREKRLQRASVEGLVTRLKRAPHMGCMMPFVEGLRENWREFTWSGGVVEGRREKRLQRASVGGGRF